MSRAKGKIILTLLRVKVAKTFTRRGTSMAPNKSKPAMKAAALARIAATVVKAMVPRLTKPVTTARTMSPSTSSMTAAPKTTFASRICSRFRS